MSNIKIWAWFWVKHLLHEMIHSSAGILSSEMSCIIVTRFIQLAALHLQFAVLFTIKTIM